MFINKHPSLLVGALLGILAASLVLFFVFRGGLDFGDVFGAKQSQDRDFNSSYSDYQNKAYGFSFSYPEGLRHIEFADKGGNIVLFEDKFQIFAQVFDEPGPLTQERIRRDIPDIVIKNARSFSLGGTTALVFESEDPDFGSTFEAWFLWPENSIGGNRLFQVTSSLEFREELIAILNTWKFTD